jgi:hypothetical protein
MTNTLAYDYNRKFFYSTGPAPGIPLNIGLLKRVSEPNSSLLCPTIGDEEKKFYKTDTLLALAACSTC